MKRHRFTASLLRNITRVALAFGAIFVSSSAFATDEPRSLQGRLVLHGGDERVDFRRWGNIAGRTPTQFLLLDVDGDRLDDLVFSDQTGTLFVGRSSGSAFSAVVPWLSLKRSLPVRWISANLDGNACQDLLGLPESGEDARPFAAISNCANGFQEIPVPEKLLGEGLYTLGRTQSGAPERLLRLDRFGISIANLSPRSESLNYVPGGPFRAVHALAAADFDGDGYMDTSALVEAADGNFSQWTVFLDQSGKPLRQFSEFVSNEEGWNRSLIPVLTLSEGPFQIAGASPERSEIAIRRIFGKRSENYRWSELSPLEFVEWERPLIGDLNGDGLDDFLTYAHSARSWSVVFSMGVRGVSSNIPVPSELLPHWRFVALGRIQAQQKTHIVFLKPTTNEIWAGILEGQPASGKTILLSDGQRAVSAADGSFVFKNIKADRIFLSLESPEFELSKDRIELPLPIASELVIAVSKENPSLPLFSLAETNPSPAPIRPRVCSGFHITGPIAWGLLGGFCPPGTAVMGTDGEQLSCCPLPASDILTDRHTYTGERCPKASVVTGIGSALGSERKDIQFRCTEINQSRYQLGTPTTGMHWGLSLSWRHPMEIQFNRLPVSLRYGISRVSRSEWLSDGCLAREPGGLFLGRSGQSCKAELYSILEFVGVSGDSKERAVPMLKACKRLTGIMSSQPECLEN